MIKEIKEFKHILQTYYQRFNKLPRLFLEEEAQIANTYINLALLPKQNAQAAEKKRGELYQCENWDDNQVYSDEMLYQQYTSLPPDKLFQPFKEKEMPPQHVLVWGRAGVGKSVLCQYLATQWQSSEKLVAFRSQFDVVIWFQLREIVSLFSSTLSSDLDGYEIVWRIIRKYFLTEHTNSSNEEKKRILFDWFKSHTNQVLILCDGYDEIAELKAEYPWIIALFDATFSLGHVLLTSRHMPIQLEFGHKFDRELECMGFLPADIEHYIQDYLICVNQPDEIAELKNFLKSHPSVWGAAHIPINLELICYNWVQKIALPKKEKTFKTLTILYDDIVSTLKRRNDNERRLPHKFSGLLKTQALDFLSVLAHAAMQVKSIILPADFVDRQFKNYCKENYLELDVFSILSACLQSGLLKGHGKVGSHSLPLPENYCFVHLSFQEFFAACYYRAHFLNPVSGKSETVLNEFIQNKYLPRYQLMWWFLSGLLYQSDKQQLEQRCGGLIRFWKALYTEPQDVLGTYHLSLVTHCLDECEANTNDYLELNASLEQQGYFFIIWLNDESIQMSNHWFIALTRCPHILGLLIERYFSELNLMRLTALLKKTNLLSAAIEKTLLSHLEKTLSLEDRVEIATCLSYRAEWLSQAVVVSLFRLLSLHKDDHKVWGKVAENLATYSDLIPAQLRILLESGANLSDNQVSPNVYRTLAQRKKWDEVSLTEIEQFLADLAYQQCHSRLINVLIKPLNLLEGTRKQVNKWIFNKKISMEIRKNLMSSLFDNAAFLSDALTYLLQFYLVFPTEHCRLGERLASKLAIFTAEAVQSLALLLQDTKISFEIRYELIKNLVFFCPSVPCNSSLILLGDTLDNPELETKLKIAIMVFLLARVGVEPLSHWIEFLVKNWFCLEEDDAMLVNLIEQLIKYNNQVEGSEETLLAMIEKQDFDSQSRIIEIWLRRESTSASTINQLIHFLIREKAVSRTCLVILKEKSSWLENSLVFLGSILGNPAVDLQLKYQIAKALLSCCKLAESLHNMLLKLFWDNDISIIFRLSLLTCLRENHVLLKQMKPDLVLLLASPAVDPLIRIQITQLLIPFNYQEHDVSFLINQKNNKHIIIPSQAELISQTKQISLLKSLQFFSEVSEELLSWIIDEALDKDEVLMPPVKIFLLSQINRETLKEDFRHKVASYLSHNKTILDIESLDTLLSFFDKFKFNHTSYERCRREEVQALKAIFFKLTADFSYYIRIFHRILDRMNNHYMIDIEPLFLIPSPFFVMNCILDFIAGYIHRCKNLPRILQDFFSDLTIDKYVRAGTLCALLDSNSLELIYKLELINLVFTDSRYIDLLSSCIYNDNFIKIACAKEKITFLLDALTPNKKNFESDGFLTTSPVNKILKILASLKSTKALGIFWSWLVNNMLNTMKCTDILKTGLACFLENPKLFQMSTKQSAQELLQLFSPCMLNENLLMMITTDPILQIIVYWNGNKLEFEPLDFKNGLSIPCVRLGFQSSMMFFSGLPASHINKNNSWGRKKAGGYFGNPIDVIDQHLSQTMPISVEDPQSRQEAIPNLATHAQCEKTAQAIAKILKLPSALASPKKESAIIHTYGPAFFQTSLHQPEFKGPTKLRTGALSIDNMTVQPNYYLNDTNYQPGEIMMPIINDNTPFKSYAELIAYEASLKQQASQPSIDIEFLPANKNSRDASRPAINPALLAQHAQTLKTMLIRIASGIDTQTAEVAGLPTLLNCEVEEVTRAVLNRLLTALKEDHGDLPDLYTAVGNTAYVLQLSNQPAAPQLLLELIEGLLARVENEIAQLASAKSSTSLLGVQAAALLVDVLLMRKIAINQDFQIKLKKMMKGLSRNFRCYRDGWAAHDFWGQYLLRSLSILQLKLTPEREAALKKHGAGQIARIFGHPAKGLFYAGCGTASLALAIGFSASLGAFHLLPGAIIAFGEGGLQLIYSMYKMGKSAYEIRQTWLALHPEQHELPAHLAQEQVLSLEEEQQMRALWAQFPSYLIVPPLEAISRKEALKDAKAVLKRAKLNVKDAKSLPEERAAKSALAKAEKDLAAIQAPIKEALYACEQQVYAITEFLLQAKASLPPALKLDEQVRGWLIALYRLHHDYPYVQQFILGRIMLLREEFPAFSILSDLATMVQIVLAEPLGPNNQAKALGYYRQFIQPEQLDTEKKRQKEDFEKTHLSDTKKRTCFLAYVQLLDNLKKITHYTDTVTITYSDTSQLEKMWFSQFKQDEAIYTAWLGFQRCQVLQAEIAKLEQQGPAYIAEKESRIQEYYKTLAHVKQKLDEVTPGQDLQISLWGDATWHALKSVAEPEFRVMEKAIKAQQEIDEWAKQSSLITVAKDATMTIGSQHVGNVWYRYQMTKEEALAFDAGLQANQREDEEQRCLQRIKRIPVIHVFGKLDILKQQIGHIIKEHQGEFEALAAAEKKEFDNITEQMRAFKQPKPAQQQTSSIPPPSVGQVAPKTGGSPIHAPRIAQSSPSNMPSTYPPESYKNAKDEECFRIRLNINALKPLSPSQMTMLTNNIKNYLDEYTSLFEEGSERQNRGVYIHIGFSTEEAANQFRQFMKTSVAELKQKPELSVSPLGNSVAPL